VPAPSRGLRAQRAARRRHRALSRLRAELGLDAWPLDVAARTVVEHRWARYVGLEIYRAHQTAAAVKHRGAKRRATSDQLPRRRR
jgi:hypothetical protein